MRIGTRVCASYVLASVMLFAWVGVAAQAEAGQAIPVCEKQAGLEADTHWQVQAGAVRVWFDTDVLAEWGLKIGDAEGVEVETPHILAIDAQSTLSMSSTNGSLQAFQDGQIFLDGSFTLLMSDGEFVLSDLRLSPASSVATEPMWVLDSAAGSLLLHRVKAGHDGSARQLTARSPELRISPALAAQIGRRELADVVLGSVTIEASTQWISGAIPPDQAGEDQSVPQDQQSLAVGPDMTWCQLYGLYMPAGARVGDVVGLSVATTAWNVGTEDCMWFPIPSENHPYIVMNLFRLKNDRFEQIGQSHIKHGFYALGSHQCGGPPCSFEPGHSAGNWLGTGCTDTYSASLNAVQSGMGPKYGVDPWTGLWEYTDSHMDQPSHSHDGITHRIQVHDADLDPAQNFGATYYSEGYYVMLDDVSVENSAAWKPVTVSGSPGGTWSFGMSGPSTFPNIGFALKAWGASTTLFAQEIPVIEFESPDGRSTMGYKATDLGTGMWHYEYAIYNIDMDRQVGSFSIPISSDMTVTNIGFHGAEHHGEPLNSPDGVPIDNAPWDAEVTDDAITWSTSTNPIRWGTLYNFRFDADAPPMDTLATVGLFKPGTPATITGETVGPELDCPPATADIDGSGTVDAADLAVLLGGWGPCEDPCCAADLNSDDGVDAADLAMLLGSWGPVP